MAASSAFAGGFAIREQSTTSQGMSFAGSAANSTLSAMYWNPAAVANQDGFNTESHGALVLGDSEITVTGGTILDGLPTDSGIPGLEIVDVNSAATGNSSGNIAKPALVTSSYVNYQLNRNIYVGLSANAPFGLV
ncbi:MAG: outer membrane protein transport protein, partial [Hyphomicrobiaceae bacterium]